MTPVEVEGGVALKLGRRVAVNCGMGQRIKGNPVGIASALNDYFRWYELGHADAKAGLDLIAADQPLRAERFAAGAAENGGPAGQLDFSVGSLRPAWQWFGEAAPEVETFDARPDPAQLSVWMRGSPGLVMRVGLPYAEFASDMAGYFAEVLSRHLDMRWVVGKGDIKHQPVLLAPSGLEFITFPTTFTNVHKERDLQTPDFLLQRALRAGSGTGVLPDSIFQGEEFEDHADDYSDRRYTVQFCDEIAHDHADFVELAERTLEAHEELVVTDGDRETLVVQRTAPSAIPVSIVAGRLLLQLVDPRF